MKNRRVRKAMFDNGMNQIDLANLLTVSNTELSVMLKYELARQEQDVIVAKINEYSAARKRGQK